MNQLAKFGIILGAICLAATLVLAVTYEVTRPKIEAQLKQEEQAALKAIIPSADSFSEKSIGGIEYFDAKKGGETIGYCIRVVANGYNGYIRMILGIDKAGIIKGMDVLEQYETPGLGSKIDEVRPGEKDPWFLRQFIGKHAATVTIKKDVDAITGATISSKAVTDAANKTVGEFLEKMRK
jgi:electron transport complex protein RnfG